MELAGIPSCSARSVTDIPFIFWLSISRAFNARSINCIVSSNFCNVRSHRIRGWLMSMSYRFYAIPRSGILFRLSKYYNFILALSNLQCKAFATSSRSFGICYNSPIFFRIISRKHVPVSGKSGFCHSVAWKKEAILCPLAFTHFHLMIL